MINLFKGKLTLWILLCMIGLCVFSCKDDDVEPIPAPTPTESTLKEIVESLGGETVIADASHLKYKVSGKTWEFEEEEPGQMNPIQVNEYQVDITTELTNRKLKMDYTLFDLKYPIAFSSSSSTKIINNNEGSQSGQYSVVSYYFGLVNPMPLQIARIEADLKNYSISNPMELIKTYLKSNTDLTATTSNNILKIPTKVNELDIELSVDLATHLPQSAQVKESDFLHGDVVLEVKYNDWTDFDLIKYPTKIEYFFNENLVKTETISEVRTNVSVDNSTFTPEPTGGSVPYDETVAKRGVYHSQWFSRLGDLGIPIDVPLTIGEVAADQWAAAGIPDQTIGENVKLIGRPDILYWGAAIKTSAGVLLVDAPLHQEWSRSMIEVAKSADGFPGEDIIGVIPTHTHFDHYGGIREMAYEAGKVYVNADGKSELESVINASHTLSPDALATDPKVIEIVEVDGVTILDGGAVEIHNVNINSGGNNPHSENMLIVYVPEYELILQADLFNAGAMLALYAGQGAFPLTDDTKMVWRERAKFLLDYISEKNLTVSKVAGMHGGLATLAQLQFVAN